MMGEVRRELPHDELAERSLLGSLMVDGAVYDEISVLNLTKDDFYYPILGTIFGSVVDVYLERQPIDYVTVCSRLAEIGKLQEVGGRDFVSNLSDSQATASNAFYYAQTVKDKSTMRSIIRTAGKVAEQGIGYTGKVKEFISEVESSFFNLTNESKRSGLTRLNEVLRQNLKDLEKNDRKKGEFNGLPTGFKQLDKILLGMKPGQLIVMAARPAMGKTSLALNVALNSCKMSGLPVALFSLEMMKEELSFRMLTSYAKVESRKLQSKMMGEHDMRRLADSVRDLSELPIMINDDGGTTILDVQSQCRKIKADMGLGLIMIDYLQLMKSHTNNPSREQQISEMSRGLKEMAKELECPVIVLSQLNRGVESRVDKRPMVSDLRESGAIEQDADVVMMIYRDEVYNKDSKEPGIAEIIVAKNRSNEPGTAKLAWVGAHTSFENLSYEEKKQ